MMSRLAAVLLALSTFVLTGCIDIEQSLQLDRNLAGKAGFTMKFDLEGMVHMMAMLKRGMEGKEGAPTAAEIEQMKTEMLSSGKKSPRSEFDSDKAELEKSLPEGIKLLGASFQEEGLKFGANLMFSFDHLSKLTQINLPGKQASGPIGNPVDQPFGGLQIVDEGQTLLITSPVENPAAEKQSEMPPTLSGDELKQVEQMLKGLRVAFKISAPFDVVEHNAHRKDGTTLVWEYDLKAMQKMTPAQMKQGVRVRYRK